VTTFITSQRLSVKSIEIVYGIFQDHSIRVRTVNKYKFLIFKRQLILSIYIYILNIFNIPLMNTIQSRRSEIFATWCTTVRRDIRLPGLKRFRRNRLTGKSGFANLFTPSLRRRRCVPPARQHALRRTIVISREEKEITSVKWNHSSRGKSMPKTFIDDVDTAASQPSSPKTTGVYRAPMNAAVGFWG